MPYKEKYVRALGKINQLNVNKLKLNTIRKCLLILLQEKYVGVSKAGSKNVINEWYLVVMNIVKC